MKKEFFTKLEEILYSKDFQFKFDEFRHFYDDFKSSCFVFDFDRTVLLKDSLQPNLRIKEPMKIRRVRKLGSKQALAKMIHSIAHIEFCAINLALDSAYRFRGLEMSYYKDWLEVADEEIKHFCLLKQALNELGFKYGDFEVHINLENALKATAHSLKLRMGVVHRGLEARGLDANPFVVEKLNSTNHSIKPFLREILDLILKDEIAHVQKGDKWWRFAKEEKDDFIKLCKTYKQFNLAGRVLNKEARLKAGFDELELERLESFYQQRA